MILITGGSYQGKLDYARARFALADSDIAMGCIDFEKRCLAYVDRFALDCVRMGREPMAFFEEQPEAWKNAIIITTDISSGVVPIDETLRKWREACGRMNNYLASHADEVWRLFCGIPQRLK